MADNYLERRMEDLRNGRISSSLSAAARKSGSARRGPKAMEGLRVVVTGGAHGIGQEIVRQFRGAGASVDIIDIDRKDGTKAAQEYGACFHPVDIADRDAFASCLRSIIASRGDIDVIVNNAAIVDFVALEENSAERFVRSLEVNLLPAFISARELALHRASLPAENPYGGRIINICSTRAAMSEEGTENYTASKGGLFSLTHALMMSLSKYGVTVNTISPGWIVTDPEERLSEADHQQHPSRRAGRPADIASLCLYIARGENSFLNGENITVDGGMTRKMIYE